MTRSGKVMLHINRSVWSALTHLWCFHRSNWSLSKVIAEKLLVTFYDLKSWSDLDDMARAEGSLVAIFRHRVSSLLPVIRCLSISNGFLLKEAHFIFLPLTYKMERSPTWPWAMNIEIPRYTFYRYWCIYQLLKVSRWLGIQYQCSYDEHSAFSIQTFSEARSLCVTWWPDREWAGS